MTNSTPTTHLKAPSAGAAGYLAGITGGRASACPFGESSHAGLCLAWLVGWEQGNRSWRV